jgi:hypothetical protein
MRTGYSRSIGKTDNTHRYRRRASGKRKEEVTEELEGLWGLRKRKATTAWLFFNGQSLASQESPADSTFCRM